MKNFCLLAVVAVSLAASVSVIARPPDSPKGDVELVLTFAEVHDPPGTPTVLHGDAITVQVEMVNLGPEPRVACWEGQEDFQKGVLKAVAVLPDSTEVRLRPRRPPLFILADDDLRPLPAEGKLSYRFFVQTRFLPREIGCRKVALRLDYFCPDASQEMTQRVGDGDLVKGIMRSNSINVIVDGRRWWKRWREGPCTTQ